MAAHKGKPITWFRRMRRLGIEPDMPSGLKRQVSLTNQLCLLALLLTVPYQLFYVVTGLADYWLIFVVNALFMALYPGFLWLNHKRFYWLASNAVLVVGCAHLIVATALVSTATGTHLIFISLGGVLGLMFRERQQAPLLVMAVVCVGLFLAAEWLFPPGSTPVVIPSPWVDLMFAGTVLAAITLLTGFSYTFRTAIEASEAKQRKTALELQRLSLTDELTGLPNRRALDQLAASEWGRAVRYRQSIALLMVDIDYFKAFNDFYGHTAGDQCLQAVANVLEACLRRDADQVARYGGEEFVILLPDTDVIGARMVASRVLRGMQRLQWQHERSEVASHVTASVGLAVISPAAGDQLSTLFKAADKALYQAKGEGRACFAEAT